MKQTVFSLLAMMLVLACAACGPDLEAFKPSDGAEAISYTKGTINGKEATLYIAKNYTERARAQIAVNLAKDVDAIVMVYGGDERKLELTPYFNHSADLVFLNRSGEITDILAGDYGYVPLATGDSGGPNYYSSSAPASIALFVRKGHLSDYEIKPESSLAISPSPLKEVANASPAGTGLSFVKRLSGADRNPDTEPVAPIELPTRIALGSEERAQGLLEGEQAVLLLYPDSDKELVRNGFWLKGMSGNYSLAFMRMQAGWRGTQPMFGAVLDVIDNASDAGENDLNRNRWWPSKAEFSRTGNTGQSNVNGAPNAVLVMRGANALSKAGITDQHLVVTNGPVVAQVSGGLGKLVEADDLNEQWAVIKQSSFALSIEQGQHAIDRAVSNVARQQSDELKALVWDAAHVAKVNNTGNRKAWVALLEHVSANAWKISHVVEVDPHTELSLADKATSRVALCSTNPGHFSDAKAQVGLPWVLNQIKPTLLAGAFYRGSAPEEYPTSYPDKTLNKVALEVVDTDATIMRGLMGRTSLPKDQGMLFVFEDSSNHDFWMKNCLMDIDIAFITEDFEIVTIHEMTKPDPATPESQLKLYPSRRPIKYAVEMESGWFKANGVKIGDRFWIPAAATEPRSK